MPRNVDETIQQSGAENPPNGIKSFSLLSCLKDFNICRDLPFDQMHCQLEGLGKNVILSITLMFKPGNWHGSTDLNILIGIANHIELLTKHQRLDR